MASSGPNSAPPRVLQVLLVDAFGGTENMVATLLLHHDRRRVDMQLLTLDLPGPIAQRVSDAGVRVRSLGGRGFIVGLGRLARILARERFDVVNAYGFKATMAVRLLVALISPPTRFVSGVRGLIVTDAKDPNGLEARVVLALERLASPLVDVYDGNSKGALKLLASQGVPSCKLHYIPNGIDASRWELPPRTLDGSGRAVTILSVARFVALKRHTDLLMAAAELAKRGLDPRLVLAGHGELLRALRRQAEELDLGDRVEWVDHAAPERVRELLAEADIFALASVWEGMPGSVMEAMAAGVPVVGTRVNGIEDLVVDGQTGLLVPACEPAQLADALERLARDRELRTRMSAAGRRRIREEFSLDRMVEAKLDLYRSLAT